MKYVMQILKRMGVFLSCTALALTMAGPAGLYVRAAEQPPEGIGKTADAPMQPSEKQRAGNFTVSCSFNL